MLRVAILERDKDKRERVQACLAGLDMEFQIKAFSDKYDFMESMDETASSYDIVLLNTTISREGDGVGLAGTLRNRNRNFMICFITESPRYYAEAFSVLATGYLLYP